LIPALACVVALAACSSPAAGPTPSASPTSASPSATPTPSATVPVSDSLAAIKVSGKRLKEPKISFKAPFAIDKTRVQVLEEGDGPKASADGYVLVHYQGVNGRTGDVFDSSFERGPVPFPLNGVVPGFKLGLTDQREGSRVLIAMPGTDAYDPAGGRPDSGINVGDTLVFVADIIAVSLTEPSGKEVAAPAGSPTVSPGTGKPSVTIPSGSAPDKMTAHALIEGSGPKVAADDIIVVRYVGYSWKTGQLIEDRFDTTDEGQLSSTIPGWQTGLVGKRVGSRVLLVLPPKDGFPQGSNNPPVEAGDTVVYVVDLLFSYSAG
jgi:peptidylprolyl isomerase